MQTLWQDLRYGARMLRTQKSVTAIAVLSLALGIGANTALFSVVDAMLLKLLPVREPERLALFQTFAPREFDPGNYSGNAPIDPAAGLGQVTSFPYGRYQRMREQERERQGALSDIFALTRFNVNLVAGWQADVGNGEVVTGNFYFGLGLRALLGRLLTDE